MMILSFQTKADELSVIKEVVFEIREAVAISPDVVKVGRWPWRTFNTTSLRADFAKESTTAAERFNDMLKVKTSGTWFGTSDTLDRRFPKRKKLLYEPNCLRRAPATCEGEDYPGQKRMEEGLYEAMSIWHLECAYLSFHASDENITMSTPERFWFIYNMYRKDIEDGMIRLEDTIYKEAREEMAGHSNTSLTLCIFAFVVVFIASCNTYITANRLRDELWRAMEVLRILPWKMVEEQQLMQRFFGLNIEEESEGDEGSEPSGDLQDVAANNDTDNRV
ncbi:unnamed protein product [Vitrella brassicaformis CCMP3155]|uniref:Uncharacterized protein n=1 Tax=Vitrella brassicaformis (strain CCMP3155) TaxID=1169540 RepID=A0A0G4EXB7_VITBC|nr:unnamed protein product [Vitrella brassicaformis CCMP3155]|eukprot:CEM03642.1 unnamed protein product [Vitrella brassicaformis CCMP3155]